MLGLFNALLQIEPQSVCANLRASRRGLWAAKRLELPSDYKKRVKALEEGKLETVNTRQKRKSGLWGLISRLFGK